MTRNCSKMIVPRLINNFSSAFFYCPGKSAQSYNFGGNAPTLSPKRTRAVVFGLGNQNREDEVGVLSFKNETGGGANSNPFLTKQPLEAVIMANSHHTQPARIAQKSTVNQKWRGPDLGECEAAFVAAFVPPTAEESVCVICAWCGCFLGGDPNGTVISHGICGPCKEAQLAKLEQPSRAIPQSWYTINTGVYTARVNRKSGKITYGW